MGAHFVTRLMRLLYNHLGGGTPLENLQHFAYLKEAVRTTRASRRSMWAFAMLGQYDEDLFRLLSAHGQVGIDLSEVLGDFDGLGLLCAVQW